VNVVEDPTFIFCSVEFLCRTIAKTQSNIDVMDVGALTPFLWAFEEREKLLEFYEYLYKTTFNS